MQKFSQKFSGRYEKKPLEQNKTLLRNREIFVLNQTKRCHHTFHSKMFIESGKGSTYNFSGKRSVW